MQTGTATMETAWRFLRKLKLELPYNPSIPLLSILLKKMKTLTWKDTCTPKLIAASFMVAQTWMQPRAQVSVDGWTDVENAGCIYNGTLFRHYSRQHWKTLKSLCLVNKHKSQRRVVVYDLTFMWNLKNKWMKTAYSQHREHICGC